MSGWKNGSKMDGKNGLDYIFAINKMRPYSTNKEQIRFTRN